MPGKTRSALRSAAARAFRERFPVEVRAHGRLNNCQITVLGNPPATAGNGVFHPSPVCRYVADREIEALSRTIRDGRFALTELATGNTQVARYQYLAAGINEKVSQRAFTWEWFARQTYWCHGDENLGADPNDSSKSFSAYVRDHLLDLLRMPPELFRDHFLPKNCFLIDPLAPAAIIRRDYDAYLRRVRRLRPNLHVRVTLGMGPKGHILYNEARNGPFRRLPMGEIAMDPESLKRTDIDYSVSPRAFTWRREIFWADEIWMLVTKPDFADDVFNAFGKPWSRAGQRRSFSPAMELQRHGNVHVFLSEAAGSRLIPLLA